MTLTVSAVLILGFVVFMLCKYSGLQAWHAGICALLGFFLASSSLAPYINQFSHALFRAF